MGSLVAELAEKLSSATNSLDFDEQTMFLNTSADTVGIGTNSPASKLDVRGTMQVGVDDTGYDVKFFGATATNGYMLWDESTDDLILGSASKIGIGTTTPDVHLAILGSGSTAYATSMSSGRSAGSDLIFIKNEHASAGFAGIYFSTDSTTNPEGRIALTNEGSKDGDFTFALRSTDNTVERMRITSAGYVGIGTSAPATSVEIAGAYVSNRGSLFINSTSHAYMSLDSSASSNDSGIFFSEAGTPQMLLGFDGSENYFRIHDAVAGESRVVITQAGNVGIGTTAPDTAAGLTIKQPALGGGVRCIGHDNTYGAYFGVGTSGYATVNALGDRGIILDADSVIISKTGDTERTRINASGFFGVGTSNPVGRLQTVQASTEWVGIFDKNATDNATNFLLRTGASNNGGALMLAEGNHPDLSGTSTDGEFKVTGAGAVSADGTFSPGGADYAEYFESSDDTALTAGNTVKLNNSGKVVQCESGETPIGVIRPTGTTGVVGNNPMNWRGKYKRDDFGVLILDDDGESQLNSDWNEENNPFTMREDRPEWNVVGLMGQVPINKGQPVDSAWIKMWEISSARDMWFIK